MRLSQKVYPIVLAAALLIAVMPFQALAEADAQSAMQADKTGTNPINFTFDARLYNEYQWLNTEGDGHQNITTAEFRAPLLDGKLQFRVKARYLDIGADLNDDGNILFLEHALNELSHTTKADLTPAVDHLALVRQGQQDACLL